MTEFSPKRIEAWLAAVLRFFRSLRLTAIVIALLIFLYLLGLVTPQKWMFKTKQQYDAWLSESFIYRVADFIGFTDIYMSPITLTLLAIFFINLAVVITGRVPHVLRKSYIRGAPAARKPEAIKSSSTGLVTTSSLSPEVAAGALKKATGKLGYYLVPQKETEGVGVFTAVKNRFSPLGFLLFHLSFLFCLVGAILVSYTRFSGALALTVGQEFNGDMRQYHRIDRQPKAFRVLPHLGLKLMEVYPTYEEDVPSRLVAVLMVNDGVKTVREVININEPLRRGGLTILANKIGISPLVEILGPSDRPIDGAYVALDVLRGKADTFKFDTDPRYDFSVLFYPDYEVVDGIERSRSVEIRNPYFHLTIRKEGEIEYDGTVRPGELAPFGMFNLKISDIRYWVEFLVIREYGMYPLYLGFALASIGLVMRLVFYQRRMDVVIEPSPSGTVIYMDGRSEFFPIAFKEEKARFMLEFEKRMREATA